MRCFKYNYKFLGFLYKDLHNVIPSIDIIVMDIVNTICRILPSGVAIIRKILSNDRLQKTIVKIKAI